MARGPPPRRSGRRYPVGRNIPINHILVILQEHRSFDSLPRSVDGRRGINRAGDFTSGADGGRGAGFLPLG